MALNDLMYSAGSPAYYTDELRYEFDDQLPLLRVSTSTRIVTVDPMLRYRYRGDLYGLFRVMGILPKMWWVTMRLNMINDRFRVEDTLEEIMIPDSGFLDKLMQAASATTRLN